MKFALLYKYLENLDFQLLITVSLFLFKDKYIDRRNRKSNSMFSFHVFQELTQKNPIVNICDVIRVLISMIPSIKQPSNTFYIKTPAYVI